ncbi:hypothetical protein B9Z55_006790 [Caenorhabditis nigoni]|uniref:Uncharacterized protein n=1 Tax=Caenorhabditis nigoni TaxID=1611254 RepID=A0A2G5V6J1_9PELO|nr:hypothetical protein B9Z55_006790 [Caenorhabditis nigoni]
MANRQSSSQYSPSRPNDTRNYDQNMNNVRSTNHHGQQPFRQANPTDFAVTNMFMDDARTTPIKVAFCRYNPLHVVSVGIKNQHESEECPDRTWRPGNAIIKFNDIEKIET